MRVYAIGSTPGNCCANKFCAAIPKLKSTGLEIQDTFNKNSPDITTLSFKGYNVHIIDGGLHADTMMHFARGITKTLDDAVEVVLHKAQTNSRHPGLKQMDSVRDQLKLLNEQEIAKPGDFVAITGSAQVYLNNLAEKMGLPAKSIRPGNVKSYKAQILNFMTNPYDAGRLDAKEQNLFAVPEVINQINLLIKKGVNVYLPAGHPIEFDLKGRAAAAGVKDDLYRMIYTRGKKGASSINPIIQELKDENIYKFNLLALSDAHVVNAKDLSGEKDYIFAAFDNCVNDGSRGVFNFYPVRDKTGRVLGYSFTDKRTIHYPFNEYPGNEHIAEISRFVGRKMEDFSYEGNIIHIMRQLMAWEEPYDKMRDVLYPINCYPEKRLKKENLREKGLFFNVKETHYYDMNDSSEFTFPKCDCEGSGRPSVVPMWGSCFASINAIKRDIAAAIRRKVPAYNFERDYWPVKTILTEAESNIREGKLKTAEFQLNKAIKTLEPHKDVPDTFDQNIYANQLLYDTLIKQKKYEAAEGIANRCINLQSRILLYHFSHAENIKSFYSLNFAHYWEYPQHEVDKFKLETASLAAWFDRVAFLCGQKGNHNTKTIAEWAGRMIRGGYEPPAEALLTRRANGRINIGDIYNEYHETYNF